MAAINVEQLVTDIKNTATSLINKDITTIKGFSDRQVKAIGQQASLVAGGIINGEITDETREFFLEGIEKMTQTFLETLQGLFWLTVEKLWNAIVEVIWGAINSVISSATGLVLPLPLKV